MPKHVPSPDLHPRRFAKNADGPFYSTGEPHMGDCLSCGIPETEAPDLLARLDDDNLDTYFVRQPTTPEEVEAACWALEVCCVSALRYGDTDVDIIKRLGNDPKYCDYILDDGGNLKWTVDTPGFLGRFVTRLINR